VPWWAVLCCIHRMMNLQGQKALPGPAGVVNIAAAVMYSGGSHMCYADQPLALSQCSNCSGTGNATRQNSQQQPSTMRIKNG
jgi:hypothetical protein